MKNDNKVSHAKANKGQISVLHHPDFRAFFVTVVGLVMFYLGVHSISVFCITGYDYKNDLFKFLLSTFLIVIGLWDLVRTNSLFEKVKGAVVFLLAFLLLIEPLIDLYAHLDLSLVFKFF